MTFLTKRFIALLALAAALLIVVTSVVFVLVYVQTAYEMEMNVKVVDEGSVGFDLNTSAVTFGKLKPGMNSERYFDINNTGTSPVKVVVKTFGSIAKWVVITPQPLVITPEQRNGNFTAKLLLPTGLAPGRYEGRMVVLVMRT